MSVTVLVGNPRPGSRTLSAATLVAQTVTGAAPDHVIDLAELAPGLLRGDDAAVAEAKATVQASSLVVVASPTFKATYSGLLKLFVDQFQGNNAWEGVLALPFMLGGNPAHALAPETTLRPLLSELGAVCALPGLYLLDTAYTTDPALEAYAQRWSPVIKALTDK
ncbi:NADPH-dependent FMN reductase [Streptomyces sp. NPDC048425]|uniref:NADPH-dependent FMN reductase n=1 Tax=Streptomyces sp. NPDC048425 TaxID=3365548 RepID=UPI003723C62B